MATCKYCGQWFDDDRGYHPSILSFLGRTLLSAFTPAVQKVAYCSRKCYDRYDDKYSKKTNSTDKNTSKNKNSQRSQVKENNKLSTNNDIDYKDIIFRLKDVYDDIYEQYDTTEKAINIKKIIDAIQTDNITSSCFSTFEDKEYYGKFIKSLNREYERLCEVLNIEN